MWVPGATAARPVYAPALVAFVGFGGPGMAAWFPLGPGEVYRPGPNMRYMNQGVLGAVTVVPRDAFVGARPVARTMMVAPQREVIEAQVVGSTAPMAPVRESVLVRRVGAAAVRTPPARVADRAVFAKTAPPVPRVSRVESLRPTGPGGQPQSMASPRNARPPAVRTPLARPAEQPRADRPAQVQERKAEQPKTEKKAVKKTERKEERKDIR